ncbi:hypothetical protein [Nostoc sp.]
MNIPAATCFSAACKSAIAVCKLFLARSNSYLAKAPSLTNW